jgi:hypothetical protein
MIRLMIETDPGSFRVGGLDRSCGVTYYVILKMMLHFIFRYCMGDTILHPGIVTYHPASSSLLPAPPHPSPSSFLTVV